MLDRDSTSKGSFPGNTAYIFPCESDTHHTVLQIQTIKTARIFHSFLSVCIIHNLHCAYFNVSGSSAPVALWDCIVCTDVTIRNLRFSHCYLCIYLFSILYREVCVLQCREWDEQGCKFCENRHYESKIGHLLDSCTSN